MYDAIIIGGGYVGTGIGYALSKAGLNTILIEQKEIGAYSSGGNYGCIQVQDANLGKSLERTLRGFEKIMTLEKEWGFNLDLIKKGSLIISQSEAELKELDVLYKSKKEVGFPIEYLTRKEIEEKAPYIKGTSILGAAYMEQGALNPFKLMYGFISKGKSYGLTIMERKRVLSFLESAGTINGVILDSGKIIEGNHIIIAGGALAVDYIKGEAFVTDSAKPIGVPLDIQEAKAIVSAPLSTISFASRYCFLSWTASTGIETNNFNGFINSSKKPCFLFWIALKSPVPGHISSVYKHLIIPTFMRVLLKDIKCNRLILTFIFRISNDHYSA